jgi:hypothetical protein
MAIVPDKDVPSHERAQARDEEGQREEADDDEDPAPDRGHGRIRGKEVD